MDFIDQQTSTILFFSSVKSYLQKFYKSKVR